MKKLLLGCLLCSCLQASAQNYISRAAASADLAAFDQTLREMHAAPFRFVTEQTYQQALQTTRAGWGDSIRITDFLLQLYRLTSLLKDGHCAPHIVQPVLRPELVKEQFFPLPLIFNAHRAYLDKRTADSLQVIAGTELVAINHQPTAGLLRSVEHYFGGLQQFREEMGHRIFPYFLLLEGIHAPFTLSLKTPKGRVQQITIEKGLNFRNALALQMPGLTRALDFRIVDKKLAVLSVHNLSGSMEDMGRFVDSCMNIVKAQQIRHLAIDIRHNAGGNSMLGDMLISYFYRGRYTQMGKRSWRISQAYKDYLRSKGDTSHAYLQQPNGSLWEIGNCEPRSNPFVNKDVFDGKVYLLTGAFTFSSANMLADAFKQYKMGIIVGEPTGENTNDFGEAYVLELPNSKLRMQLTTSFDTGVDCKPARLSPVLPDILVRASLQEKLNGTDAVLAALRRLIDD